ncbi:MAG: hypothetical protein RSB71_00410 [Bacilli bacterium]
MDFISDNYIWFIIGGVVIIMAIIGYFAEKTDFGRKGEKPVKEPKVKKEKIVKEPEHLQVDAKGIAELSKSITEQMQDKITDNNINAAVTDDLYAPLTEEIKPVGLEAVSEDLMQPLTADVPVIDTVKSVDVLDDLNQPLYQETATSIEQPVIVEQPIEQPVIVEQPIEQPVIIDQPVIEPVNLDNLQTPNVELTNIEPTTLINPLEENKENNIPVVDEEEDIWKF